MFCLSLRPLCSSCGGIARQPGRFSPGGPVQASSKGVNASLTEAKLPWAQIQNARKTALLKSLWSIVELT